MKLFLRENLLLESHFRLLLIIKGQLQRKYKLLSCARALKMLKNEIRITVIGQTVLEIYHFKVNIPRKSEN